MKKYMNQNKWIKGIASGALSLVLTFNTPIAVAKDISALDSIESLIAQTSITAGAPLHSRGTQMTVTVTAYSSTEDQTDDSPFTTASNKQVTDGIVAANFLPFGTKLQIPKLFGDKVFVVEDRMHNRFGDRVDIWFADRDTATKFGKRTADIVIL